MSKTNFNIDTRQERFMEWGERDCKKIKSVVTLTSV